MPSNKIPDRWEDYDAIGKPIPGTRFLTFKVPLKEVLCSSLPSEKHFTPDQLIEQTKECGFQLGLVVDLTNTARYYDPKVFLDAKIEYQKIYTEGKVVPSEDVKMRFLSVVDDFIERNPADDILIGVHCTHGVNRTGHLVCRYMVDRLNIEPDVAIKLYDDARGHRIERENYLEDLKTCPTDVPKYEMYKSANKVIPWKEGKVSTDFRHPRGGRGQRHFSNREWRNDEFQSRPSYFNRGENADVNNSGWFDDSSSHSGFGRNDSWESNSGRSVDYQTRVNVNYDYHTRGNDRLSGYHRRDDARSSGYHTRDDASSADYHSRCSNTDAYHTGSQHDPRDWTGRNNSSRNYYKNSYFDYHRGYNQPYMPSYRRYNHQSYSSNEQHDSDYGQGSRDQRRHQTS